MTAYLRLRINDLSLMPPGELASFKQLAMTKMLSPRLWQGPLNRTAVWLACLMVSGIWRPLAAEPERKVDFAREIRPIFNKHCVACHGGVKRAAGISFIVRARALSPAKSGAVPIKPGDPSHSELIRRVTSTDDDERMPPPEHGPPLAEREIALLRNWIQQGAEWEEHWAYVKPQAQGIPAVSKPDWCRQPLDRFVLAQLDREQLRPSAPADRIQWLRRASLDLTGLPPMPSQFRAFLADVSPDAFEKAADRLLSSPAFGERWATLWLDLARYADTQGYERDYGRTAWPYRDWLIRALNEDMPYDQFTIRQLGGDLLEDPTLDDLVATMFHRNTQTNAEGGSDDEEFRVVAVLDRVNTTWQVWQGVTFRCVQCHAHPYDPIEHADYYRFAAIFNTSQDWDLFHDLPLLSVPVNHQDFGRARHLDRELTRLRAEERREVQATESRTAASWRPLNPSNAVSTKQTRLEIRPHGEGHEIVTAGTVSHNSRFTIDIPIPPSLPHLTALRIEASPKDPKPAQLTPELGFVISHMRALVYPPGIALPPPEVPKEDADQKEKPPEADKSEFVGPEPFREIHFAHVFGDESQPLYDPEDSLKPDKPGWGALPRIDRPRHAVFVPTEPETFETGATLRVLMSFLAAPTDQGALVMNRGRFLVSESPEWTELVKNRSFTNRRAFMVSIAERRAGIESTNIPVMKEQEPSMRRASAIFVRGNWLDKGERVKPGVPDLFPPLPTDRPPDRLAVARWLVSPENPLTARVAVSRVWEQLFGIGLVETLEDFGSSGLPPTHPELLDFLALRFQNELGWSTKRLLRELVLSATYRQDAAARPDLFERDPRNRLLARGPRTRLTAEMIRDQALSVCGLLSSKMNGPPVMPPQPDGIWRSAYNSAKWETSKGQDQHRRALYTYCKRTSGYPSFMTFDATSREVCTARRVTTSTPLQALVTLNDPVYMECAQMLATRMITEIPEPDAKAATGSTGDPRDPPVPSSDSPDGRRSASKSHEGLSAALAPVGGSPAEAGESPPLPLVARRIAHGWELALGRKPANGDLDDLIQLYRLSLDRFQRDAGSAAKLATSSEEAALTVVANAMLNLDAFLTK